MRAITRSKARLDRSGEAAEEAPRQPRVILQHDAAQACAGTALHCVPM
jgi:hypothetical protein